MPQFGRPDESFNKPSWAPNLGEHLLSRHPHPGTNRADGLLIAPPDLLQRPIATQHAGRIHTIEPPIGPPCRASRTPMPTDLEMTITGTVKVNPNAPQAPFDLYANGTFPLTIRNCQWSFSAFTADLDDTSVEYFVYLWQPGLLQTDPMIFECILAESRFSGGFRIQSGFWHITAPIPVDANFQIDAAAAFPLAPTPRTATQGSFGDWDFEVSTVTVVDVSGPPPPPPDEVPEYPNWEWVSVPLLGKGVKKAKGWSGTTGRGMNMFYEWEHHDTLPTLGVAGTEIDMTFFRNGIQLGNRRLERSDVTDAFQADDGVGLERLGLEIREPDDNEPLDNGEFVTFSSEITSECWQWWNSHRTYGNFAEGHPNGSVAIQCEIEGWNWAENKFDLNKYTWRQEWFRALVNKKHVLEPVWDQSVQEFQQAYLVKIGNIIFDPDAKTLVGEGAYYTFAIVFQFSLFGCYAWLHTRVINDSAGDQPFWENQPSVIATVIGMGPFHGGIVQQTAAPGPLNPMVSADYPLDTRNFTDQGYRNIKMFDVTPGPHPWMAPLGECKIHFSTLAKRGTEAPLEAPLDMKTKPTLKILVPDDGSSRSIDGGARMPFGSPVYDRGGWFQPLTHDDRLIVPPGVVAFQAIGNIHGTTSTGGLQIWLEHNTNIVIGSPYAREALGFNGEKSQNVISAEIPCVAGDTISLWGNDSSSSFSTVEERNWLFVKGIAREVFPWSATLVPFDAAIPPVSTQMFVMVVTPIMGDLDLTSVHAYLGRRKDEEEHIIIGLSAIRFIGHVTSDLLLSPIQIDDDHWSSESSSSPPQIDQVQKTVHSGDILIASILVDSENAEGLTIALEFSEAI